MIPGDAGRGALVDGNVLDTASPRASMLFNGVTFITPGADAVTVKNGARIEFIDCFTYFANRGLYLEHSLNQYTPTAGSYNPNWCNEFDCWQSLNESWRINHYRKQQFDFYVCYGQSSNRSHLPQEQQILCR